jgi:hypothetical protein
VEVIVNKLYEKVLNETRPYLTDRAEVFLSRQCNSHLNIRPEELKKEHLPMLAKWVFISASLLVKKESAEKLKNSILSMDT